MGHYLGEMEEDGIPLSMKPNRLSGGASDSDGDFMKRVVQRRESRFLLQSRGVEDPSRDLIESLTKELETRRWEFQRVREAAQVKIDQITGKALDAVLGRREPASDPDTGDLPGPSGEAASPPAPTCDPPQAPAVEAVYCVNWTEVEPGWGDRPDGHTLHASHDIAVAYCDAARARPTSVDQCYSVPGQVFLVEVDTETAAKVRREGTIWGHHTQLRARS